MGGETFRRACEVFDRVCDLGTTEQLRAVERECRGDPQLEKTLRVLLDGDRHPLPELEVPVFEIAPPGFVPPEGGAPPARLGSYTILEKLGEGGMAVVYKAQQDDPEREVALKLLGQGLVTQEELSRFRHEVRALGQLNHPGIAHVYEASTEPSSRGEQPFIAMELVDGVPLDEHGRTAALDLRARVELLARVCDAVHHAHQKAIVHLDLKPANILIDPEGRPKVVDFGIAVTVDPAPIAIDGRRPGLTLGTLPYMSPEQLTRPREELDVRSDVYSLGVVGYQLLSSKLPYRVDADDVDGSIRTICETAPAPLELDPPRDCRELSAILSKALEKDPDRRYASASELAEDLRRFQRLEPTFARGRAGRAYEFGLFARRNKVAVSSVAALILALLAGVVAVSGFARSEARQRHVAEEQRGLALQAGEELRAALADVRFARDEARAEAVQKSAVSDFLTDMLSHSQPGMDLGRDLSVREVLDLSAGRIGSSFADQPGLEAAVRSIIGQSYFHLGLYDQAEPHLQRAHELHAHTAGERSPEALAGMRDLGVLLAYRGERDAARRMLAESLEACRQEFGDDDPATLLALHDAGGVHHLLNDLQYSEELLRAALEGRRRILGNEHEDTLVTLGSLGNVMAQQGRPRDAEPLLREAYDRMNALRGPDHPDTLTAASNLAGVLWDRGGFAEARDMLTEVVDRQREVLGEEHPETQLSISNLGVTLIDLGEYGRAEELFRSSSARVPPRHPQYLNLRHNLAQVLFHQGRLDEALELIRLVLSERRELLGPANAETLGTVDLLGNILRHAGRHEEAVREYRSALADAEAGPEARPPMEYWLLWRGLGLNLVSLQRLGEAEAALLESYEGLRPERGDDDVYVRDLAQALTRLYERLGNRELEQRFRARLGEGH